MSGNIVLGTGLNDADYPVKKARKVDGKVIIDWECPYYAKWKSMLTRCYSKKYHITGNTYLGCSVCEEWLTFSNFKRWMETQDWEGKQLDKDLFGDGKLYSPETCCFISRELNVTISYSRRNSLGKGVFFKKSVGKYCAQISDKGKRIFIGYFDDKSIAEAAYLKYKTRLIEELVSLESKDVKIRFFKKRGSCS